MDVLVAILIAGGVISIGAHLMRRYRDSADSVASESDDSSGANGGDFDQIQPGDVVIHDRIDMVVEEVYALREGTSAWTECVLRDGARRYGLVLHPGDPDHALVGRVIDRPQALRGEPPESIDHEGIYNLRRCGQARASDRGGATSVWDHWEYARPGGQRLWLRRAAGELRCYVGARVARHLLEHLPRG